MNFLLLLLLLAPLGLSAQRDYAYTKMKNDTVPCLCSFSYSLQYPKRASENNICGSVIIEIEVDSLGLQSNPKVVKGLGYGCDEAALQMIKNYIRNKNQCQRKCGLEKQKPKKRKQVITFACADKEEATGLHQHSADILAKNINE